MRKCPIKRGMKPDLKSIMKECFGAAPEEKDGKFTAKYGALSITAWIDGKFLICETVLPQSGVDATAVADIIKRHNSFLEKATGYTAKERLKMAKKEAEKKG